MTIRFAQRVLNIDISGIRKMFEAAGSNAINLGLGQPDFDTPEHIKQAAIDAINEGFTGYTQGAGIPELRQALSSKFERENNFSVTPNEVIVTSGASEALELAIASLVNPGDDVLIANPGFVSYNALGDDLSLRPEDVVERITPRTKAFIVNSPANPTGAVQSRSDMKAFAEIADDHGLTLISDEVYEHFIYEGEHVSPAQYSDNVITINATSKTYSMTGWRLGYIAARQEYVDQMIKVHQYVQACANSIAQKAAVAALNGPIEPVIRMREEFRQRRDLIVEGLNSIGMRCDPPKGAFYAFPQVDNYMEVVKKCVSNGVVVVPGTAFGSAGEGYMRLSYATSKADIKRALEIMEGVL
jgi:aspartate aminotransferase